MSFTLDSRLAAAAELVGDGSFLADIGTDHAYLPIYLVSTGKAERAVASDLREGPIKRAKENIKAAGLTGRIEAVRANGLSGLENYPFTDIVIAGMGGILISEILGAAPWTDERTRLILQPMRNERELRLFLSSSGYTIDTEKIVCDGRIYQFIRARHTRVPAYTLTEEELRLGRENIKCPGEGLSALCGRELSGLEKRIKGLRRSGHDASAEERIYENILRIKEGAAL